MATQLVEFPASTGRTLTAVLYSVGSDTASATASSTVESTNRKGVYVATFTGLVGDYLLVAEDANSVPACIDPLTAVTNTAATFQTNSISNAAAKVTTTTNLTNAPTAGDLTATMKTSVQTAATAATPTVTAGTVSDKTGYVLAASGLDQISVADPGGIAGQTTFPKRMLALWRHFFGPTDLNTATGKQTDYADDGTTVNVQRTVTDDGTIQVQGKAT